MTEDTNLEKRVQDLEDRVSYLESELELSVEKRRFERKIKRICRNGNNYEIDVDGMGYYTATVTVMPEDLPNIASKIDGTDDIGWRIGESAEGEITISIQQGLIN